MNIGGGEAADQLVRMMLTGTEAAVRLSGSALKNMLALSLALAKNHKRISGKINLGKMLRETRDLRQFPMTLEQYHQFQKLAKRQKLLYSSIHDRDGHGKIIDVILPVTELDRANQIFERMLYQEPSRHPERQGPQEAEKTAPRRQEQPVQEERQEGAQSRQKGPVAQQQAQRPKKDFRSERDSHDTRTSSSTSRESGSTGMTFERPSVLERLKSYRAQLDQKSAPARQKTKNQHMTR